MTSTCNHGLLALASIAGREWARRDLGAPPPVGLPVRVLRALERIGGGLTQAEQWAASEAFRLAWTRAGRQPC